MLARVHICFVVLAATSEAVASPAEADELRGRARLALSREDFTTAAKLLEAAYEADRSNAAILQDLAVALASGGRIEEAAARYREYLTRAPGDEAARLAMATTLTWSKNREQMLEGERLLTEYLARHPDATAALLQRARVRSWSGQSEAAEADFRAYLVKHPVDEPVKLELAMALSSRKDPAAFAEAIAIYDAHLARRPTDLAIVLQRGRVRAWAGQTAQAIADYRAYLDGRPHDDAVRLELANVVAQGPGPGEAVPLYDDYLRRHPDDHEARRGRIRALMWTGDYPSAERAIGDLRAQARTEEERRDLDVERARLYAQTQRRNQAMDVLDDVLARDPDHAAARAERDRLSVYFGWRVEPRLFFYQDKAEIRAYALSIEGRAPITRRFGVLADASAWSLGSAFAVSSAGRANLGAYARVRSLEVEAAGGPRTYEFFEPRLGGWASIGTTPVGWAKALIRYQYDDIYQDMLQTASVAAGIRGHYVSLIGEMTLPLPPRVRVFGRVGSRHLLPDNRSFDGTGTIELPVVGPLSVGYNVQHIRWRYNDPAYWSPQAFSAHLLVVRVARTHALGRGAFAYDVQGVGGIAGERVEGVPEAGFGPSFGSGSAVLYSPTPRVELRLAAQYMQTVREVTRQVSVTGGSQSENVAPVTTTSPSRYWWTSGSLSAIVYF